MDSVTKACILYVFLLAIIRVSGRRTLGEMTAFDFVLFLISAVHATRDRNHTMRMMNGTGSQGSTLAEASLILASLAKLREALP